VFFQLSRHRTAALKASFYFGPMSTMASHVGASPTWEKMWGNGLAKGQAFDTGGPSECLLRVMDKLPKGGRALVPGGGRGYDAHALVVEGGMASAVTLDLSTTASEAATAWLSAQPAAAVEVRTGDFFKDDFGLFDVIWDCTFLCALQREVRDAWAERTVSLLQPGGELVTLVFPITAGKPPEAGPPFPLTVELVEGLLEKQGMVKVEVIEMEPGVHMKKMAGVGNTVVRWRRRGEEA